MSILKNFFLSNCTFLTFPKFHMRPAPTIFRNFAACPLGFILLCSIAKLEGSLIAGIDSKVFSILDMHKSFIIDFALNRGWNSAQLVLPKSASPAICDYFVLLIVSNSELDVSCELQGNQTAHFSNRKPIILADLNFSGRVSENSHKFVFFYRSLLETYSKYRPILVLYEAKNLTEMLRLADVGDKMSRDNYKWTATFSLDGSSLEIFDVFRFATSSKLLVQRVGAWHNRTGLRITATSDSTPYNFGDHLVRVTTVSGAPVVILQRGVKSGSLTAIGYLPDMLNLIAFMLNFTYIIQTPEDGKFGEQSETGNWSGMVGMLQQKDSDVALMSFSLTKSRRTAMDFSPPVEYSSTRLLINRDLKSVDVKLSAFLRPFQFEVWVSILLLIGFGSAILALFSRLLRAFRATPGESIWLVSTCFLNQGQDEHNKIQVAPYRFVVGTFWILSVFVYACYTARITSFLAADTEQLPLRDLDDALSSKSWKIGLVKGSSFQEKVRESKGKDMQLLYRRIQDDSSVLVTGFSSGIEKVHKERYIFFTSDLIPTFLVKGNCSFGWLPGKYFSGFGYMGYQKQLPFAAPISRTLQKVREVGLMRRTFNKWWGTATGCSGASSNDGYPAIGLHEVGSAFIVLGLGACAGLLFAALEFLATLSAGHCGPFSTKF